MCSLRFCIYGTQEPLVYLSCSFLSSPFVVCIFTHTAACGIFSPSAISKQNRARYQMGDRLIVNGMVHGQDAIHQLELSVPEYIDQDGYVGACAYKRIPYLCRFWCEREKQDRTISFGCQMMGRLPQRRHSYIRAGAWHAEISNGFLCTFMAYPISGTRHQVP